MFEEETDYIEEETDVYQGKGVEGALDDDEISTQEEGFMKGYNDAVSEKKKSKKKTLNIKKIEEELEELEDFD